MDQTGRSFLRSASTTATGLGTFLLTASLVIAFAAGLQGCSQTKEGATSGSGSEQVSFESRLPACWKVQVAAEGPRRDSLQSWLPEGRLPSVIELDTTLAESAGSDSVYEARSRGGYPNQSFTTWRYSKGDSIRVEREGAMAGMMLQLKPTGDTLTGSVVAFTDTRRMGEGTSMNVESPRKRGPIEAIPVECKSE